MNCPKCDSLNPPSAPRCACGFQLPKEETHAWRVFVTIGITIGIPVLLILSREHVSEAFGGLCVQIGVWYVVFWIPWVLSRGNSEGRGGSGVSVHTPEFSSGDSDGSSNDSCCDSSGGGDCGGD